MTTWLLLDAGASIESVLRQSLTAGDRPVNLVVSTSVKQALASLATTRPERLVLAGDIAAHNGVDLVSEALRRRPDLELVVCSPNASLLDGPGSLATGICFVGSCDELVALRSKPRKRQRRSLPRPDLVDIVRLALALAWTCEIKIISPEHHGTMQVVGGCLVAATTGALNGNDAFLQMVLWEDCQFRAEHARGSWPSSIGISAPTVELLQEAVNLCRAIAGDADDDGDAVERADIRDAATSVRAWWDLATTDQPSVVRVLVGSAAGSHLDCARRFTDHMAEHIKPERQWSSAPPDGPTFVRLHSGHGTVLTLTFVPMSPQHRFYFESFAGRSDAVVICRPESHGDSEQWRSWVRGDTRLVFSTEHCPPEGVACPAVLRLAESGS